MECLELQIPPLPQLVTAGHAVWRPGMQHFRRSFAVYDMIFIRSGTFYMTEEDREYTLRAGDLLTLEPGKTHWGHHPVDTFTDVYWIHFVHSCQPRLVDSGDIPWSQVFPSGTDADLAPVPQLMYVPKHARLDLDMLTPLLDEIILLHRSLTLRNALRVHALAGELFNRLQSQISARVRSRAYWLCERVIQYLHEHVSEPFDSRHMERELHYDFDYMSRCLKQYTNMTPLQYKHHLQIERAKSLLLQTDLSVKEIAERAGQPDSNYFVRLFRKHVGVSPGRYRSLYREVL